MIDTPKDPKDMLEVQPFSVPGPGYSLTSATEAIALKVRAAIRMLVLDISSDTKSLYVARFGPLDGRLASTSSVTDVQVAWALIGMWLTARLSMPSQGSLSFSSAEQWFFGPCTMSPPLSGTISSKGCQSAEELMSKIEVVALADLMPYVLDPHGPSTRRDVIKDENNIIFQERRRTLGAYYTPSDVTDYMSNWVLTEQSGINVLDPACGSGVFLLALAKERTKRSHDPIKAFYGLYGIDIDPLAIDASCFVLTAFACQFQFHLQPAQVWHLVRLNMAVRDTLSIQSEANIFTPNSRLSFDRSQIVKQLIDYKRPLPKSTGLSRSNCDDTIETIFPEVDKGFDAVIGNPPYSPIGQRDDINLLAGKFSTLRGVKVSAQTNTFIPFVNLMWSLTKTNSRSAMIVPMSIAYHSAAPFRSLRCALQASGGKWKFHFFDRTPDAIFGDDVKQRTAILLREGNDNTSQIFTSKIHRWTSHHRGSLFSCLPEALDISEKDISRFIPKMSMGWEKYLYQEIQANMGLLASTIKCYDGTGKVHSSQSVVGVGSTAYNWLVLYRDVINTNDMTNSILYETQSSEIADWLYAVLASRVTLWLWRVQGDAFHVPSSFVLRLPYSWQPCSHIHHELAILGRTLWDRARANSVVSLNSGRRTVSFRTSDMEEIDTIDKLILSSFGMPPFVEQGLKEFVKDMILVGRKGTGGE